MSKKKKNLFTLLGLCVLLAVCIVLYFVVPKNKDKEAGETDTAEESKDTIVVDEIDSATITKVEIRKSGKTTLALVKKDDEWRFSENRDIPLDSESVTALFNCLNPVAATKTLDKEGAKLEEYGLDNPSMTIKLTAAGKEYQYDLGISVPVEGGYYGLASSGDKIYCMKDTLFSTFDINQNTLIKKDELPEIKDDYMTYIHVDNKKGRDFEAKAVGESERVADYSSWNITKPYARPLATSMKDWSTTLGYFNSWTLGELVQYGCEDLSKYGLENPVSVVTVKYFEVKDGYTPAATATPSASDSLAGNETEAVVPEKYRKYKTIQLFIGNKKNDAYYVCLNGSKNVYTMTGDVVKNMIELDAYTSMDHCVYATLATKIKGFDVTYGNTAMKITRTAAKEEEKKDDANENNNIWHINGKKVPAEEEDTFLTPYSAAYLLEFTAKADDSVKPESNKPVLTIVYHENGRDVTVKYLPYDGTNFYRVDKDGMDYFLVDKRSVDDIITKFKKIEKFGK